jgi:hypothetical protein
MKHRFAAACALLTLAFLPACGTAHGVRWAYGAPSIYEKPDSFSEGLGARAIFGVPVIVGGLAFDAVTFPAQLIFGVWPMWGPNSPQMNPNGDG